MIRFLAKHPDHDAESWILEAGAKVLVGRAGAGPERFEVQHDKRLSRSHFWMAWNGRKISVERVPQASNPLFYQGKENDAFELGIGEYFVVGHTRFSVAPITSENVTVSTFTLTGIDRGTVRHLYADDCLSALQRLWPELKGMSDEVGPLRAGLRVLAEILPGASGLLAIDSNNQILEVGSSTPAEFLPSLTVCNEARKVGATVSHVWAADAPAEATVLAGVDWAAATPVPVKDDKIYLLYVGGHAGHRLDIHKRRLEQISVLLDLVGETLARHLAARDIFILEGQKSRLLENNEVLQASEQRLKELLTELEAEKRKVQLATVELVKTSRGILLGEVGAWVAHDVNNRLQTAYSLAADWSDRERPCPPKVLKAILKSVETTLEQVKRLQEFSQANSGGRREEVVLADIVKQAFLLVGPNLEGIEVRHELDSAVLNSGDRYQLQDLVVNLLLHSAQSIARMKAENAELEGRIEVSIFCDGGMATLAIADNGVGLDTAARARFFSRLDSSSDIGARLIIAAVGAHQGKLTIESEVDQGTRFQIEFPLN